jgi:hypothetical protein
LNLPLIAGIFLEWPFGNRRLGFWCSDRVQRKRLSLRLCYPSLLLRASFRLGFSRGAGLSIDKGRSIVKAFSRSGGSLRLRAVITENVFHDLSTQRFPFLLTKAAEECVRLQWLSLSSVCRLVTGGITQAQSLRNYSVEGRYATYSPS